jgi:uncharacterized protein YjdB
MPRSLLYFDPVIECRLRVLPLLASMVILSPALLRGQAPTEVQVTPAQVQLKVGARERLFLSAYDADGNLLSNPSFTFAVAQSAVVRVEADGTVVGVGPGTTSIEVRSGTGHATVSVTVTGPPPPAAAPTPRPPKPEPEPAPVLPAGARLVPDPDSIRLLPLESATLSVGLLGSDGSGLGRVHVTWTVEPAGLAAVNDSGVVTALQAGPGRLTARGPGGLTAAVPIRVTADSLAVSPDRLLLPADAMDTIRVTVPAQDGRVLASGLTWRSSDPSIARTTDEGVVLGMAPGQAYILISGFGQQRSVRVTVHPHAARLRLVPAPGAPLRLTIQSSTTIELQAFAADSAPITDLDYRWRVADTTVAAFDPATRRLSARGLGRTTLTMTVRGFDPFVWEVEVVAGALSLAPNRLRLALGARDSLRAMLLDAERQPIGPASGLTYTSDRPDVVTVDPAGALTGRSVGSATVSARTSWGTSAEARVFVTQGLLLSVRRGAGGALVTLTADGAGPATPLLADGAMNLQAKWSPDGTRVVYTGVQAGNIDIYVMDADGQHITRLTDAPEADQEPAWSPDGDTIVFTSLRGGTSQIWAMNADGTGLRQLTSGLGANSMAAYSPDGRAIAFISTRDGNADLFEMGAEGDAPRPLTRTPEAESGPAYFPNGDIAVVVARTGRNDILRLRAGDGQRIMLQSLAGRVTALAVARDGASVAYTLSQPGADKNAPPVVGFYLKSLAPDLPPAAVKTDGEVLSASFQAGR